MDVSCDHCNGACCLTVAEVPATTAERNAWPYWLRLETVAAEHFGPLDSCPWLEDGRCRHYDIRPQMCREYPVGGVHCLEARERFYSVSVERPR